MVEHILPVCLFLYRKIRKKDLGQSPVETSKAKGGRLSGIWKGNKGEQNPRKEIRRFRYHACEEGKNFQEE